MGTVVSALGTGVGYRIPVNTPIREACARARGAFWGQKALFVREGPIAKKIQLFERTVQATAMWNAGVFMPQKQGMQSLNACQAKLVRSMRGKTRQTREDWLTWEIRTLRKARADIHQHALGRWSTIMLRRVWDLWGHVGRQEGLTRDVFRWRSLDWWRGEQRLLGGSRHPGRFCPHVDPERLIQAVVDRKCPGRETWESVAQDRTRWQSLREAFVEMYDVPWASERQTALEDGEHIQGPMGGGHAQGDPPLALPPFSPHAPPRCE